LAIEKLHDLHYELLSHPLCSTVLAPSDFHLLPQLKKILHGNCFSLNCESFKGFSEEHFREGINGMENRWGKIIKLKADLA